MDNFTGQTTDSVFETVEEQGIVIVMVPAGTTDRLQPLDVSTNKATKDFLRQKFRQWYADQVQKQIEEGVEVTAVQVNMGMPTMKDAGAQWLTALYDKLRHEKTIVINGFKKVGIVDAVRQALDDVPTPVEDVPVPDDSDPFEDC